MRISRPDRFTLLALALCLYAQTVAADEPPPRTEAELLQALSSPQYQTRRRAVLAVEGRTEPALLARILQMAETDPHANIRGYTADVLSTFQDVRVFPILANMVDTPDFGPRQSALVGLGRHGDKRAYALLIKGLTLGRALRGYAAKGLGLFGDRRAFTPIEQIYRKHLDDPYLNTMAPDALVQLDRARGLALCREAFVSLPEVARPGLARTLGQHTSDETRTLMVRRLLNGDDARMRDWSLHVLTELADPKSGSALLRAFKQHADLRGGIARALGRIREAGAVRPLLTRLTTQPGEAAKHSYIEALGRIGDERAVATLVGLLDDTTFAAQPMDTSRSLPFPFNVTTRTAAWWSIRSILDGKPPVDVTTLSTFPRRADSPKVLKGIAALKTWWAEHKSDSRYHLRSD